LVPALRYAITSGLLLGAMMVSLGGAIQRQNLH
jgi:hypothetical protein